MHLPFHCCVPPTHVSVAGSLRNFTRVVHGAPMTAVVHTDASGAAVTGAAVTGAAVTGAAVAAARHASPVRLEHLLHNGVVGDASGGVQVASPPRVTKVTSLLL